jgi:hypothetical protein
MTGMTELSGTIARSGGHNSDGELSRNERFLRMTASVFLVALVVHGADHLRRGTEVITSVVRDAGAIQAVAGVIAVVLVFRRHRLAPAVAAAVGFASAIGFIAAHLVPHWSVFSDSFTGSAVAPRVNAFSWFAALFEIAADLAFAVAGLRVMRSRR